MSDKPFRILGIQQIAIGGPDKQMLKALWVDMQIGRASCRERVSPRV